MRRLSLGGCHHLTRCSAPEGFTDVVTRGMPSAPPRLSTLRRPYSSHCAVLYAPSKKPHIPSSVSPLELQDSAAPRTSATAGDGPRERTQTHQHHVTDGAGSPTQATSGRPSESPGGAKTVRRVEQGISSGVDASASHSQSPVAAHDSPLRRLLASWQQGVVASIGAVMGIGFLVFFLYTPVKEDTVHHTAVVASEALGDARLKGQAVQLSKDVVLEVLRDPKSLDATVDVVVDLLAREETKTAVSSLLQSLFEDHYTQEVTKKFVLRVVQDPWIQDELQSITEMQAGGETVGIMGLATPSPIAADRHHKFIHQLDLNTQWKAQHLKMNGVYWGLSALILLRRLDYRQEDVIKFVISCYNEDGGFGGNTDMDSHLLFTMSAVQLLCIYGVLDHIDVDLTAKWIASMQLRDGSFQGDKWGEVDTRFSYIALSCLRLLDRCRYVDLEAAVQYVLRCQNWDGGFGVSPGAESHAGQIFCCVGALCLANALHRIDGDRVAAWLAMRQLPSGGLNGRPEKKADVCYSWWVVASLSALGRTSWIDKKLLFHYILSCQDTQDGGFSDKPGNQADVYHTFFGLCGLSLLGYDGYDLAEINPVYALPYDVLDRMSIAAEFGSQVGRRPPQTS